MPISIGCHLLYNLSLHRLVRFVYWSDQGDGNSGTLFKMTEPKKIMIVDDHTIMRDGLQALLSSEPNYEVVGTVADGKTAIQSVATLQPDIILMDLTMPGTSGIEAIEHIKRRHPRVRIIALTFHKEDKYIHATLEAGADAYVLKDDSRTELFTALASVTSLALPCSSAGQP